MLLRIVVPLSIFLFTPILASQQYSSETQNRSRIELNGTWFKERVTVDHKLSIQPRTKKIVAKLQKESGGRYLSSFDDSIWQTIDIPRLENIPPDTYQDGVWYRRNFFLPEEYKNKSIRIQFEAVNYVADVWINGIWVGTHEGGYTPFSFDISQYIEYGNSNTIAIRVDNIPWEPRVKIPRPARASAPNKQIPKSIYTGKDIVPYKTCDWWNYGGITRTVFIEICENIHIQSAYVKDDKAIINIRNISGKSQDIVLIAKIWSTNITEENILDSKPSVIIGKEIYSETKDITLNQEIGDPYTIGISLPVEKLKKWSPDNPTLYVLEIILDNGDHFFTQFGIRKIQSKSARIFINDKMTTLTGIARHEIFGENISDIYQDLLKIKEINANFLRTAHYPNKPELYILADRLGIVIWEEIPVYWFDADGFNNIKERQIADNIWREMIWRDYNRPSVIFWGTCNECGTQTERKEFIKRLYKKAKEIDGTRLIAQSAAGSDPLDKTHEICDVIGVTMYYGIFYGKDYYGETLRALEIMHSSFPDKPIIVTEYGTWSGTDLSLVKKQVEVAEKNIKAFSEKPYVSGFVWWCLYDWYSMITTFETMGAITLKKDFVKPVFYTIQKLYGNLHSSLIAEITEPFNYATVKDVIEIKTNIKSDRPIIKKTLLINGQSVPTESYIWDTKTLPDGEYIIHLKAKDTAGITQQSIKKIFVDNIDDPPKIQVNISDGDFLMHKKNIDINLTDDRSPPMDLIARLFIDDEEKEFKDIARAKFSYLWEMDNLKDNSKHTLKITAADSTGNMSEKIITVTIDNAAGNYIKLPYNHDWISWQENMSDGTGWDFPAEELPYSNLDFYCGVNKFFFGDKSDGKFNNVECNGQTINIPLNNYSSIHILASSHDGSTNAYITLVYENGKKPKIPFPVSDWWGAIPYFGEDIGIKASHHHERNARDNEPGAGIYVKTIKIDNGKKIKAIILPNEPKLHVFAITLL